MGFQPQSPGSSVVGSVVDGNKIRLPGDPWPEGADLDVTTLPTTLEKTCTGRATNRLYIIVPLRPLLPLVAGGGVPSVYSAKTYQSKRIACPVHERPWLPSLMQSSQRSPIPTRLPYTPGILTRSSHCVLTDYTIAADSQKQSATGRKQVRLPS